MKLIHTVATALVLGAATLATANAATYPNFIGQLVPTDSADRTVLIDPSTRYVNVTQGEKLKFVANGREFVIDFNGAAQNTDLRDLAPPDALDHKVDVYVDANPYWMGAN